MLRMLALFWAVMSTAGLLTEVLFRAAGLVPTHAADQIAPAHFSWNYTTYLNIIFLVALRPPLLDLPQPGAARWRGPLRPRPGVRHAGGDGAGAGVAPTRRTSGSTSAPTAARTASTRRGGAGTREGRRASHGSRTRVIERLDRMVASGRITRRRRTACVRAVGTAAFDAVITAIRARHAQAHTDTAVMAGTMSPEDAAYVHWRIGTSDGEHSADLRRQHSGHRLTTAAGTGADRAQSISPSPLTSAPIFPISRSCSATSGSRVLPRRRLPPRASAAGRRMGGRRPPASLRPRSPLSPPRPGVPARCWILRSWSLLQSRWSIAKRRPL